MKKLIDIANQLVCSCKIEGKDTTELERAIARAESDTCDFDAVCILVVRTMEAHGKWQDIMDLLDMETRQPLAKFLGYY